MISLVFPRKLMALFLRLDRPETRVRLQCYFLRSRRFAETEQIDPEPTSRATAHCDAAIALVLTYPSDTLAAA
jgi:hypothetical protein